MARFNPLKEDNDQTQAQETVEENKDDQTKAKER